jgi:hypothetical protein
MVILTRSADPLPNEEVVHLKHDLVGCGRALVRHAEDPEDEPAGENASTTGLSWTAPRIE